MAPATATDRDLDGRKMSVPLELKQVSGDGTFEGMAAVFGNVDRQGDVIEPGAFDQTVRDRKQVPLLWAHNAQEPIGVGQLSVTGDGLKIDGELNLDVQRAQEIHALMKQGAVEGLSIGYDAKDFEIDRSTGVRRLKSVQVGEVSLAPTDFQANPDAEVTAVKMVERTEPSGFFVLTDEETATKAVESAEGEAPDETAWVLVVENEDGKAEVSRLGAVDEAKAMGAARTRAEFEEDPSLTVIVGKQVAKREDGTAVFQDVAAFRFDGDGKAEGPSETKQARPDFDGTEDTSPEWADDGWAAPNLSDHPEASEGDTWEDLSDSDRSAIAARAIVGTANADTYGELGYWVVNPATDNLNRNGLLAARQRASQQGDAEVAEIADALWEEFYGGEESALSDPYREKLEAVVSGASMERVEVKAHGRGLSASDRALIEETKDALDRVMAAHQETKIAEQDWSFLDETKADDSPGDDPVEVEPLGDVLDEMWTFADELAADE